MKSEQKEFIIFSTLFNIEPADVTDKPKHEINELQSNNLYRACYHRFLISTFHLLSIKQTNYLEQICSNNGIVIKKKNYFNKTPSNHHLHIKNGYLMF